MGIPSAHTDFIFAYITYTFGWFTAIILAVLIMVFLIRMTRIAIIVKNNYARLLVIGLATIFAVQFLWNIAMNLGFAPISGVGLPFISYGGSQLISNALAVGIILSIYRRKNLSKLFN
jgi:cell division protein FtsW (lipid II flippase)